MTQRTCLTIVLAAGEGTRMRSSLPKVLHPMAGRPLYRHVLEAVLPLGGGISVVIGPNMDAFGADLKKTFPNADVFVQHERKGTAHAVLAAKAAIARGADDVLVVFADTPLIRTETFERLRGAIADGAAVAVLGFHAANPTGYGRLIVEGGVLTAIREEKDASTTERAISFCNGGVMALAGKTALKLLETIGNNNAKQEFYLTDAVELARVHGLKAVAIETDEDEVRGVNTQAQLAETGAILQTRLRLAAMDAGVRMAAPETVQMSADTMLGKDVVIDPYVVFGPGVVVEDGAHIRSFSHLEGARVGRGAIVGPYARLRPGAKLGEKVRIGNFVEVKESEIGDGSAANHLTYIGDTTVGANANIGAGTITCNYDGAEKHRTEIGDNAFIGSNSALVAPVKIGDGAYVGSGSVITRNVPPGSLAVGRARQEVKEGWAERVRELKAAGKVEPKKK